MTGRLRGALGLLFVVAAAGAAVIGLGESWDSIVSVATGLSWWQVVSSFALVLAGVAATAVVWSRALARCGHPLPIESAAPVFFVGQLGKYLPGSVWSIGAAAVMLRRRAVPVQTSVATSLIFLVLHFAPGLVLAGLLVSAGQTRLSPWWGGGMALLGLALLAPPVLVPIGAILNRTGTFDWHWLDALTVFATMAVVWTLYAGALLATVPGGQGHLLTTMFAAFVVSFALGVAVPIAPAGLGVRESVLIFLLTPPLGFEVAAAVTLFSRVTHTGADLALAGLAAAWTGRPGEAV